MLRCSGCAGLVSEWAARCPACGHSVEDAQDLVEPAGARRPHGHLPPDADSDPYLDASSAEPTAGPPTGDDGDPGAGAGEGDGDGDAHPAGDDDRAAGLAAGAQGRRPLRYAALVVTAFAVGAGTTAGVWLSA